MGVNWGLKDSFYEINCLMFHEVSKNIQIEEVILLIVTSLTSFTFLC